MADTASYAAVAKSKLRPKRKRRALPPGVTPVKANVKVRGASSYTKGRGRPD